MMVYVLMQEWCNGYESNESMMDIYATEELAMCAQIAVEATNYDTEITFRIDARPVIYG